jgi:hypothetical protein
MIRIFSDLLGRDYKAKGSSPAEVLFEAKFLANYFMNSMTEQTQEDITKAFAKMIHTSFQDYVDTAPHEITQNLIQHLGSWENPKKKILPTLIMILDVILDDDDIAEKYITWDHLEPLFEGY